MISVEGKTNFFEKGFLEYSKAGVGVEKENMEFTSDADFKLSCVIIHVITWIFFSFYFYTIDCEG